MTGNQSKNKIMSIKFPLIFLLSFSCLGSGQEKYLEAIEKSPLVSSFEDLIAKNGASTAVRITRGSGWGGWVSELFLKDDLKITKMQKEISGADGEYFSESRMRVIEGKDDLFPSLVKVITESDGLFSERFITFFTTFDKDISVIDGDIISIEVHRNSKLKKIRCTSAITLKISSAEPYEGEFPEEISKLKRLVSLVEDWEAR